VKYLALEGSTLTLLGLIKYDAEADRVEINELVSVIAGGIEEAQRVLTQRLEILHDKIEDTIIFGSGLMIIGSFFVYRWYFLKK